MAEGGSSDPILPGGKRPRDSPPAANKKSKILVGKPKSFPVLLECPSSTKTLEVTKLLKELKPPPNIQNIIMIKPGVYKIFLCTEQDVNRLLKHWDNSNFGKSKLAFNTSPKQTSLVVRNVPLDITDNEFMDLLQKDHKIKNAKRIISSKTGRRTSLVRIWTNCQETASALLRDGLILDLIACEVEESLEAPRVTRCFKCQNYGHTAQNCPNDRVCPNCSGDHGAADCPKDKLKCKNCMGDHKASDKKCPKYIEQLKSASAARMASNTSQPNPATKNGLISYAEAVQSTIQSTAEAETSKIKKTIEDSVQEQFNEKISIIAKDLKDSLAADMKEKITKPIMESIHNALQSSISALTRQFIVFTTQFVSQLAHECNLPCEPSKINNIALELSIRHLGAFLGDDSNIAPTEIDLSHFI